MRIRISARPQGKSPKQLDELVWGYNREFLLYWVDTIIETANQLYTEDVKTVVEKNEQEGRNDVAYCLQKPIHLATRLWDINGYAPIEIEVPDAKGYKCVSEAISLHIANMPLTIREMFANISQIATATEA
ncbi:hypothetical protein Ngar_c05260 [Candidatus Nitrososphaera gargensis Ga9.2]|uniref:Uncharacterized protein n=1 Tax=Nitrososphaera gargensis (strain Ga9.2) TaxID=1237085 RepID=K0ILZ8_NITGG|nr:hypothetical protein [Candidatus Nitrososphaera gargensis]AFU57469.1 hypothetical protein Ngar_c05260 [Candidatus Nitrososphaera gargensis Ga9.2]